MNESKLKTSGQKLEALWVELQTNNPTDKQLLEVVRLVKPLRERAWEALMQRKPSLQSMERLYNDWIPHFPSELPAKFILEHKDAGPSAVMDVFCRVPSLRNEAAKIAIEQNYTSNELIKVVGLSEVPLALRVEAANKIMDKYDENVVTENYLTIILLTDIQELVEKAASLILLGNDFDDWQLSRIIQLAPAYANTAWEKLKANGDNHGMSLVITTCGEPFKSEAAQFTMANPKANIDALMSVMEHVPSLATKAWEKLSQLDLSNNNLNGIALKFPAFAKEARAKMKPIPRDSDSILADIKSANFECRSES